MARCTNSQVVDVLIFRAMHAPVGAGLQNSEVWGSVVARLHALVCMYFSAVGGGASHAVYGFSSAVTSCAGIVAFHACSVAFSQVFPESCRTVLDTVVAFQKQGVV